MLMLNYCLLLILLIFGLIQDPSARRMWRGRYDVSTGTLLDEKGSITLQEKDRAPRHWGACKPFHAISCWKRGWTWELVPRLEL